MSKERIIKLSKINPQTGCWEWQSARNSKSKFSYGHLIIGSRTNKTRRTISAHRYSYQVFIGDIPDKLWVLHKCDNPICVNPEHLFIGSRQDNINDRERKNRNKINEIRRYGENHPFAKLNWNLVNEIRRRYNLGQAVITISKEMQLNRRMVNDVTLNRRWKVQLEEPK